MTHHITRYTAIISIITLALTGCDDGLIEEKNNIAPSADTYTMQVTGNIQGINTWNGSYTVAFACFSEGNDYADIVKTIPATAGDTLTLKGVPSTATTAEIAILSPLRKRIATIYSYSITDEAAIDDTIKINVGDIDASMFTAINTHLFQGNNCSRCHQGASPAAQLDLSKENAYSHIVNVPAHKEPSMMRVKPGNAEESFLYKVMTDPDVSLSYSHAGLFTDPVPQAFQQIMKNWINAGAKQ